MASGGGVGAAPFVLTLELDGESFSKLNELRRRHYPPERNVVPAHVTLFHRLPGDRGREIKALLKLVSGEQRAIDIPPGEVKGLERGVALFLRSPRLQALRDRLASEWEPWLTDQDRVGFRPHVTIQNNVTDEEARKTQRTIAATFRPPPMRGVGLHLWRYRDGPWEDAQVFRFR